MQSNFTSPAENQSPKCAHRQHSKQKSAAKRRLLNQYERQSIADQCLIHGHKWGTVARQFGVDTDEVKDVLLREMFARGFQAGRNAERFQPADSPRTRRAA